MKLINYVEEHIFNEKVFEKIFSSQQAQIDKLNNDLEDLVSQAYICTATWGLQYWEEDLDIRPNESDTITDRRSRCFAKIRGTGNCTIDYIKNIALSYKYGDITIVEDYENYKIKIKFSSDKGVPANIEEFKKTLRTIIPAHLGIEYEFIYNTVADLSRAKVSDLAKYTVEELLTIDLGGNENDVYLIDENNNFITDEGGNRIIII